MSTWILYLTAYRYSPNSLEFLDKILAIFRKAKNKDASQALNAYSQWFPLLIQAISRHWTLYKSQSELDKLNLEDFLEESLRIIGQSIEGISKSFLKLLLHMSRIRRNKETSYESINSLKLGLVVNELIEMEGLKEMFIISPFSIRLNQWRNISYHHNSKIIKKRIFCWYKQKGQKNEFEVEREELVKVLSEITNIYRVLRIAETVFCIDNLEKIEPQINKTSDELNIRKETELLDFYAPINSQGFKIISLESTEEQANLIVKDMMEYPDLRMRAIHASQFLYHLWLYTSSKSLKVEYFTSDSKRLLTSEINFNSFEKRVITGTKFSELMKEVRFNFILSEMKQNKNPFKNLKLSKGLNKVNQRFYSQGGDSISLNEFI